MSTNRSRASLAARQSATRVDPRMAYRRMRVAFAAIVFKTPEPKHLWHDNTREQPRSPLPNDKEREMIHGAIHQKCTTPELILRYRIAQLHDDYAQFENPPRLEDIFFVELIREQSQAIDAQARAHAFPTPENLEAAARETEDAVTLGQMCVQLMRSGRRLLHRAH